jgi:hypothetical protein
MRDAAQQWLTERAAPPGMLVCGLRGPDGLCSCRSAEETYPAIALESVLMHFDNVAAAVFTESPAPRWSTWAFEHGYIRFVERPDGWRLALVVRAGTDAASALDSLSEEFLAFPADN